jgi:ribonuclease Z
MRLITLGTGAGRPSLIRNSSATALEYEGDLLLFDCGEATQHQLMKAEVRWGKLDAVFIGHLHGDHLNGLPGLLGTFSMSERQAPLKVFGPPGIARYVQLLQECKTLWVTFSLEVHEIRQSGVLLETPRYAVTAAPLDHVIECWGFRFQEKDRPGHFDAKRAAQLGVPDGPERARLVKGEAVTLPDGRVIRPEACVGPKIPGRSVAYCCDTKPCASELALTQGADWVVHEATFEEALKAEANAWGHSTTVDAARIARESSARRLLMTHISQRYQDGTALLREALEVFPETTLAVDLGVYEV